MYIEALGKDFPLCYTVEAQSKLAERAGRLENIQSLFERENSAETVENTTWMLAVMMEAHVNREKVKCRMLGTEYKGGEAPTYEELRLILNPTEIGEKAMLELSAAMKAGGKTTVEVKEEKRKNAKATQ